MSFKMKSTSIELFVLPVIQTVHNLFPKFESHYNQSNIPEEAERFFYLRQSIWSYLVFSDAFGKSSIIAPGELIPNLKELESLHFQHLNRTISTFGEISSPSPESA